MTHPKPSHLANAAALCLALAAGMPAQAQGTTGGGMHATSFGSKGYSILPYTRSGYVGLNLGSPDWNSRCVTGFNCSNGNLAAYLYTGGLINDVVGVELGYVNTGGAERNGGTTRAQGVNLSLVARVPIGAFNAFAKLGALYGQTRVSADAASGVTTGTRRGWGASYALGVGYDFTEQMGVVLEWSRDEFRVPGVGGTRDLDSVSLGLVRRF